MSLLALSASAAHAQELKKGNVVGIHVSTIKLAAGVTMESLPPSSWRRPFPRTMEKAIPAYENLARLEVLPGPANPGEKAEGFGLIIVIATEAERDKYYNADGSPLELGKAANVKIQPIMDEMNKLGTITQILLSTGSSTDGSRLVSVRRVLRFVTGKKLGVHRGSEIWTW